MTLLTLLPVLNDLLHCCICFPVSEKAAFLDVVAYRYPVEVQPFVPRFVFLGVPMRQGPRSSARLVPLTQE